MQQDIVASARHVVADEWSAQARGQFVREQVLALQCLTQGALRVRSDDATDTTRHVILLEKTTALGAVRRERLIAARPYRSSCDSC